MLLYQGGTVCDDHFDDNSANAVCREMGHVRSTSWKSGGELSFGETQNGLNITLDKVKCIANEWTSCSYSILPYCVHSEDIFLSCQAGKSLTIVTIQNLKHLG